jgi:hypothetical protein
MSGPASVDIATRHMQAALGGPAIELEVRPAAWDVDAELNHIGHRRAPAPVVGVDSIVAVGGVER